MWIYPENTSKTQEALETKTQQPANEPQLFHFSEDGIKQRPMPRDKQQNQGITPIPHPRKAPEQTGPKRPVAPHEEARAVSSAPPKYERKQSIGNERTIHVRFFAALYALGAFMAGVIRASLAEEQLSFLQAFLQKLLTLTSTTTPFKLFAALFMPAFFQLTLIVFMSFCAFGIPLMAAFLPLCGIGAGLPAVESLLENGLSGTSVSVICFGIYQAVVAAEICLLAQNGSYWAEQIFCNVFSAPFRKELHKKTDTAGFFKRYLYAVMLLILLCGSCAAVSGLSSKVLAV